MEIRHGQEFGLAVGQPFLGSSGLALWTVPVAASNGQRPLPVLWGAIGNGELAAERAVDAVRFNWFSFASRPFYSP
jgi:hypothetical protein